MKYVEQFIPSLSRKWCRANKRRLVRKQRQFEKRAIQEQMR